MNQKLTSAFLHLRFDEKLLTYDLKKAFNMLALGENDQARLLFLWFRNVSRGDFDIVAYKNVRLSFGLRCSPFLLMISLYYMLVHEDEPDPKLRELKNLLYALLYMDNGAVGFSDSEYLKWAYSKLSSVFSPYRFELQKLITNDIDLQEEIDKCNGVVTPVSNSLFGMIWNRITDEINVKEFNLNPDANTKRKVLQSIASQFDVFGYNMPVLNRSRLFMHRLQCQKELSWDQILSLDLQREWRNICKQVNGSSTLSVSRYVGPREGKFKLIAYTDASHDLYGVVVYILHIENGRLSFLQAKNRMINKP